MKKARLLITVLVCSLMLTGVGYAWWTDSINMTGTATTGNIDVVFGAHQIAGDYYAQSMPVPTIVRSEDGKQLTCTFTDVFPGAVGFFQNKVRNDGTVPVKFDNAEITLGGSSVLQENLQAAIISVTSDINNPNFDSTALADFSSFSQPDYSHEGLQFRDIDDFLFALNNDENIQNLVIESGQALPGPVICLRVNPEADNTTQDKTVSFTLNLNWTQYNAVEE